MQVYNSFNELVAGQSASSIVSDMSVFNLKNANATEVKVADDIITRFEATRNHFDNISPFNDKTGGIKAAYNVTLAHIISALHDVKDAGYADDYNELVGRLQNTLTQWVGNVETKKIMKKL